MVHASVLCFCGTVPMCHDVKLIKVDLWNVGIGFYSHVFLGKNGERDEGQIG